MEIRVTRARRIHADGRHNAFTGIAALAERVYVVCRAATTHVSRDGQILVLSSAELESWSVVHRLAQPGADLRDPKVVAFGGRLLVYTAEAGPGTHCRPLAATSQDGAVFDAPRPLTGLPADYWLWQVCALGETLYGTAYAVAGERHVVLVSSTDGFHWQFLTDLPVPGNETFLDFGADGRLWALVRADHNGCVPALCTALPPYTRFLTATYLPMRLQGPMLKRLANGCVIVGRNWDGQRRNLRTELYWLGDQEDIRSVRWLPSGGDTSYAGWLDRGPGQAVISYYSSHEHKMDEPHERDAAFAGDRAYAEHTTAADILLADISWSPGSEA